MFYWWDDKLNCRPQSQTCFSSFSQDTKKMILVKLCCRPWSCKFHQRISFHAKLATMSPGALLHPPTFREEKKNKKQHTDRKFPPEPYNHCNTDTLQPRLFYHTMTDRKTSLDSKIRMVCSCVNKYMQPWIKLQIQMNSFKEIRKILHQGLQFRWCQKVLFSANANYAVPEPPNLLL